MVLVLGIPKIGIAQNKEKTLPFVVSDNGRVEACEKTLRSCLHVRDALVNENQQLLRHQKLLTNWMSKATERMEVSDSILPGWAYVVIGGVLGVLTYEAVR